MSDPAPPSTLSKGLTLLAWHLRHPQHLPNFVYQVRLKLTGENRSTATKPEASAWCEQRAVSTAEAVETLTGEPMGATLPEHDPALLDEAERRASELAIEMGGPADLDLLYWLVVRSGATDIIETGVAFGWSSLAILAALGTRGGGRLVSIDLPYAGRNSEKMVGHVVPERLRTGWTLIRRADRQGVPKALRLMPAPDLVHYDSDKAYPGRMWSYPRLWGAVKPGGMLISDDVGDNLAFRDFCRSIDAEPVIVRVEASQRTGAKFAGVLRKPA
jgi:hypothetical protein